jgi:hypothetical protein
LSYYRPFVSTDVEQAFCSRCRNRLRQASHRWCRGCCNAYARERHAADPEPLRARARRERANPDHYKRKAERQRQRYLEDPQKVKDQNENWRLKCAYGITLEDKRTMLEAQNGKCAICDRKVSGKSAHVDHDHETGQVRGILCHKCNVAIGLFGDEIRNLTKAIDYLRRTHAPLS